MSGGALSDYDALEGALEDAMREVPTVLSSDDEEESPQKYKNYDGHVECCNPRLSRII